MFHYISLTDKASLAYDALELLDVEVGLDVDCALVLSFVNFSTDFARIVQHIIDMNLLKLVLHRNLFSIHP